MGTSAVKGATEHTVQLNTYVSGRKWNNTWETAALERFFVNNNFIPKQVMFAEYSRQLGSLKQAKSMLSQFTIVGVTERETAFLRRLCKQLALPTERCTDNTTPERKALMAEYDHHYPAHPKLKDFTEEFRRSVSQWLQTEYQIYEVAESLSRALDTQEMALAV